MIYSFRGSVTDWLERTLSAQIYVSPGGGAPRGARLPDSLLPTLAALPGMAEVVGIRAAPIDTPDGPVGVSAAPFKEQLRGALQFLAGDPTTAYAALADAQRETPAVLASEPLAWRRQLKVGDRLQLATDVGWRAFEVVGIYQDFGSDQGHLLMDEAAFRHHWNRPGVTGIGLYLAPGADEAALVTQIQALATPEMPLSVMRTAGILAFSLQIFDRTFAVTGVLRLLTLIVSLAGVTSALMALQLERTRECAVLRALGMTPGQVRRWVTLQTALMGAVAGLLAVPVGLVLAAVLTGAVNQRAFGWTIHFQIAPGLLLQALGLAVLAALVAGAYPAWRMGRTPPALALREE
jgi:putative ABC transport system permease protein